MSYTPVELRHVRVGRSLFGYNRRMVEQVIEEVAESFEATWRERGELADQVDALEKQVAELRRREELLTHTLVAAEQAASDVRDRAKREAESIVTEAHNEARALGRAAQAERERLLLESRRIEAMLRAALSLLEEGTAEAAPATPAAVTAAASPAPVPAPAIARVPHVEPEPVPVPVPVATPVERADAVGNQPEPTPWLREDTREFEPISLPPVQEALVAEELPMPMPEPEPQAQPVLRKVAGGDSRDFDWGE
jgi:cell division initiation protein